MVPLSKDALMKLNYFASKDGEDALLNLVELCLEYYHTELINSDGNELYRNQGAAQLLKWLKLLPKGLKDGRNATSGVNLG